MPETPKPHATGSVAPGDIDHRVGVEILRQRDIDVEELIEKLIDNAAAEFASTYYYYSILRMYLAGHEDYKEICEDARLEDRQHRDGKVRPSGHFRRGAPGEAPYSRNRAFHHGGAGS